jgi:hypothetical protein
LFLRLRLRAPTDAGESNPDRDAQYGVKTAHWLSLMPAKSCRDALSHIIGDKVDGRQTS